MTPELYISASKASLGWTGSPGLNEESQPLTAGTKLNGLAT
jgi:hypothetical protein